jgi:DNA-binding transcriptional regulator YiaG
MDIQIQKQNLNKPDYKKIYQDIIMKKFPEKMEFCFSILNKEEISVLNIIEIDRILFGMDKESRIFNQKHRSYDKETIGEILEFQKKYSLTNIQLASHFKLSRNTVAKWKKLM